MTIAATVIATTALAVAVWSALEANEARRKANRALAHQRRHPLSGR